jgi:protein-S-isoprenylcysteine O-methyltransferase Ste14
MRARLAPRPPVLTTSSTARTAHSPRLLRVAVNVVGAASAAVFSYSFLHFYLESHRPIGVLFFAQQTLVALAYLVRRPARLVTHRLDDWLLAFAGTFIGVLFRPAGEHPAWGIWAGTVLQLVGVGIVATCILTLGRSFGFAAADRGVVTRGPYAFVRHPMYASYLLLGAGYLLQSLSVWNAAVLVIVTVCNGGRALAEERLLANNSDYLAFRRRVRRRIVPGVW